MEKKPHNSRSSRLQGVAQTVAQTEPKMPKYTELRGNVYWFKRRAPKPLSAGTPLLLDDVLTSVGKNSYVKFTLRTSNSREAAKQARKYAHLLDEAAASNQNGTARQAAAVARKPEDTAPLSADEIKYAADLMFATLLAADEQTYAAGAQQLFSSELCDEEDVREPDRFLWSSADLPPLSMAGQAKLLQQLMPLINQYLYRATHKVANAAAPELLPFADAFRRYVAALEMRKQSIDVPTPAHPERSPESSITLSVLYQKFRDYKTSTQSWKNPVVSDRRDYGPLVRDFIATVGDKRIDELTRKDGEKYFEHTMARTDLALGTKKRNFDRIKTFLTYGENKHSIPRITASMEIEASYKKTHKSYERFTHDELKSLFHCKAYEENTFNKASEYWLPLIGLYTGARIDEIASLPVSKVAEIDGVWCYFMSSEEGNQKGKNEFAPRWIPMHPEVVKAGFVEHWKTLSAEGHVRMFPELGNADRDGPAKRATDDFIKFRRSVKVGSMVGRGTKVFHSLRSTLVSELITRGTDDYTRIKMLGHSISANDEKHKGVHFDIYDQSNFDAKRCLKELSKANFGLKHTKFRDTTKMKLARAKHKKMAERLGSFRP